MDNNSLVDLVVACQPLLDLKSPRDQLVLEAMRRVDRKRFMPPLRDVLASVEDPSFVKECLKERYGFSICEDVPAEFPDMVVYQDGAIPIGYNQTCSQPSVVAMMADLLQLEPGMRVLELGTGCGYNAAIIAEIVSSSGQVTSLERISSLADLARQNLCGHFGNEKRVTVIHGDGGQGYVKNAPYDRVIFTAGIQRDRFDVAPILSQCPDGIFVFPQHMGPVVIEEYRQGKMQRQEKLGNFGFVPLQQGVAPLHE